MSEENTAGKTAGEELTQEQKDQQFAEKYRAQLSPESTAQVVEDHADEKPQRPEHIPEKFWDAEKGEVRVDEMAKSYAELEKGKAKPAEKAEAKADENLTDEEKAAKVEAEKAARATLGLPSVEEIHDLRQKMTEKMLAGESFDDSDYAPFEKMGLDRETVDVFAQGLIAIGEVHKAGVYKEAGGEDAYKAMIEWARTEYTPAEIAAYDRDVHSMDKDVSMNAVRGLAARFKLATGHSGKDVTRQGAGKAAEGYRSKAEMVADMRKPEYRTDEAFRREVEQKVAAARRNGVDLTV